MTHLRSCLLTLGALLLGSACGGAPLCERSTKALAGRGGDCVGVDTAPLLGDATTCGSQLGACSGADQQALASALGCLEQLPVCSASTRASWLDARAGCVQGLATLSTACADAFFMGTPPGLDAGAPDAGPQPLTDGGHGVTLVGVADLSALALAWERRQPAEVARWVLVTSDATGRRLSEQELGPGTVVDHLLADAGAEGRRFFVVGRTAGGEIALGTPGSAGSTDGGARCGGPADCPGNQVCDLGQCRQQTCPYQQANTCPPGYQCFSPGVCEYTGAGSGGFDAGQARPDAGLARPLPMISNEVALQVGDAGFSPAIPLGGFPGQRPDVAAADSARLFVTAEQEGQLIGHFSTDRGASFPDDAVSAASLDPLGTRARTAWNPESRLLFACYTVGRGVRVQRSADFGRTWGAVVNTFEPPLPEDGGVGGTIRDCDIAPWKNGGAALVTIEGDRVVVRHLSNSLSEDLQDVAFEATPLDAGTAAIFAPAHPAIATLPSANLVHVTFTGARYTTTGSTDTEPFGVVRDGSGGFSPPMRLTGVATSPTPEDWTAVTIHPASGRALAVFSSLLPGTGNATVYAAVYSAAAKAWGTGSHLNALAVNSITTRTWLFPEEPGAASWNVFSPTVAPLRDGRFAIGFVAGPKVNGAASYRQYVVPFDLDGASPTTARGWFVLPVQRVSEDPVFDPRGSSSVPPVPVSALTADTQISVVGAFVSGVGAAGETPGVVRVFTRP